MTTPTKAISLRAPAWHEILYYGKDIENRSWPSDHRGPIYLHASTFWDEDEMQTYSFSDRELERMFNLGGHVVGTVEIVDCVRNHQSKWAEPGAWHFVLRNPQPLAKPFRLRGQLKIFDVRR